MARFTSGVLQGIRPLEDGGTVYYRWLDFHLDYGIQQAIFDSSLLTTNLTIGKQYDLLLSPFPLHYSLEQPDDPTLWSAKIIALDWQMPFSSFSAISCHIDPHLTIDQVLLEAPFGRLTTIYPAIAHEAGIPREQIVLGAYISWEKDVRLDVLAIV